MAQFWLELKTGERRLLLKNSSLPGFLRSFGRLIRLVSVAVTVAILPSVGTAQIGCAPNTPNYPCVYVANPGTNSVSAINATTSSVIATIAVGPSPTALALTPDNASVYVTNAVVAGSSSVLGSTVDFAVLASGVSNDGFTVITGDLGEVSTNLVGFPPGVVYGTIHRGDQVVTQALTDAATAFNRLFALPACKDISKEKLDGLVLVPGVYCFHATPSAVLNGVHITLDFQGLDNTDVVFQIPGELTTGSGTSVVETNLGKNDNVYWVVGAGATVGDDSQLVGTILSSGINLSHSKIVRGRVADVSCIISTCDGPPPPLSMNSSFVENCVGSVSVIDTASNSVSATIPLQSCPRQIAITPDGRFAYVVEASASIEIIDTSTNAVVGIIDLASGVPPPRNPTAIAFTPDGSFAYVAGTCPLSSRVSLACVEKVSTASRSVVKKIIDLGFPDLPASIAITPDGEFVCLSSYAAVSETNDLYVTFIRDDQVFGKPLLILNDAVMSNYGFGITSDGILYIAEQQSFDGLTNYHNVGRVDTKSQRVLSPTIGVGSAPTGIAVGANGAVVYVTNEADNTVSVINTKTLAVLTTAAAFSNPQGVTAMTESPPVITTQPATQSVGYGQTATLNVVATSLSPLTYHWYQGQSPDTSMPVAGASASSFTFSQLSSTTNYWVQVSNVAGSVNSTTATITVTQPFITSQPGNQTITALNHAALSVAATGAPTLFYQWYQGHTGDTSLPIAGATSNTFTSPLLTLSTSYWVRVTNNSGSVDSATATITVIGSAPTCGPPPLSLTQAASPPLTIAATVTCTDPQSEALTATVAWGDNSQDIVAGNSPLTITQSHTYPTAGFYTLMVTATDAAGLISPPALGYLNLIGPQLSLFAGQSGNVVGSVNTPTTQQVQFKCTTLIDSNGHSQQASALGITCNSDPIVITLIPTVPPAAPQNVTLVIHTTGGAVGSLVPHFRQRNWLYALWLPVWSLAFVGAAYGNGWRDGRRLLRYLKLTAVLVLLLLFVSCASGGFTPQQQSPSSAGTPPGTYQLTIVDEPAPGSSGTGFVQTTLIVQLTVVPFQ